MLSKLKIHCRFQNKKPENYPFLKPKESNPQPPIRSILILFSYLSLCAPSGPLSFVFPYRKCARISFVPLHAIRSTHLIKLAHLISPVLLSEQNKLWSSCVCSFLHSPLSSFFSGPNISLSTLLSTTLGLRSALGSSSGPGAYAPDAPQPIDLLCDTYPPLF